MPDNRYNVDDILRELGSKQSGAAPGRAAPVQEDGWAPVGSRQQPPPQQRQPQQPVPQQPRREPPQRQAAVRELPRKAQEARLGQQPQRHRTQEEMGRLLNNFSESEEDPLSDLDFLEGPATQDDFFGASDGPARSFQPDWDRQPPARQAPPPQERGRREPLPEESVQRQRAVAPQRQGEWQQYVEPPAPPRSRPPQPVQQQRPPQREQERPMRQQPVQQPQQRRGYPDQLYQTGGIPRGERHSMADAARLITGGGLNDFPDQPPQTQPRARQSGPTRAQQPAQRPMRPQAVNPAMQSPAMLQGGYPQQGDAMQPYPQPRQGEFPQQRYPVQPERPTRQEAAFSRQQRLEQLEDVPVPQAAPRPARQRPAAAEQDDIFGEAPPAAPTASPAQPHEDEPPRRPARAGGATGLPQVAAQLARMRASLLVRALVNLLAAGAVIYLVLAGSYELPLPEFLSPTDNTAVFLWSGVLLVALSAIISGNTVGGGILALFKLRPSNDSYTALAVFASLMQGAYMAMQPGLMEQHGENLYLPIAALILLFNTLGKLIMLSRMCGSFSLVAAKGPKQYAAIMDNREFAKRIASEVVGEEPNIVYAAQTTTVDGFLERAFSESRAEDVSRIVAPLTALAALVMALVSYLFSRDIFTAACAYTAALCITAPMAGVIATNLPLSITNGKLARWGATLCGYDAVSQFATANGVVLRAAQLFPKGSVVIQDIQVLDRRPIDQILVDAASVLCNCDSYLAPVFGEMIQDPGMLFQAENLEFEDGMGICAWVNGRRVLIGNRNMMAAYGVAIPDADYERQYCAGSGEVLYLANSGEASAMYLLTFKTDKTVRRTLELACENDLGVCVYSNDPTLSIKKISQLYSFPEELLTIIPAPMHAGAERYLNPMRSAEAGVIHNGSPASFLRTILAARSCSRCVTLQMALILMSVVLGFTIVTFLAFTRNMEALTWITLTVFQFFWLLLELSVPLFKH